MRKGLPIAVITILSLLILILTNFSTKSLHPRVPIEDLRAISKLLSPLAQWDWGLETLKSYSERNDNPLLLILVAIALGERGDYNNAVSLLKRAESLLPSDSLPPLLQKLYDRKENLDKETVSLLALELKNRLRGWFRDKPLARLYRLSGNITSAEKLEAALERHNRPMILRIAFLTFYTLLVFLAGIFLLIFYLSTASKRLSSHPEPPPSISWGWAIAIIFIFIITQTAIAVIPLFLAALPIYSTPFWRNSVPFFYLLSEITGGLLILHLTLKLLSQNQLSLKDIGFKIEGLGNFLWGLGGFLSAFPLVVSTFALSYLLRLSSIKGREDIPLLFLTSSTGGKIALFFLVFALAPIFEELMFRGILYPSLRRELGVTPAIALSSFFFASIHANVSQILPLMALGALFSFLYEKKRSLIPSIIAHALWNAQNALFLFLLYT
ncbi:CPBP family intramembrane metalloprotease [bacterium]|nr:CPBP family intramembrane metalloprotease [bacterium]